MQGISKHQQIVGSMVSLPLPVATRVSQMHHERHALTVAIFWCAVHRCPACGKPPLIYRPCLTHTGSWYLTYAGVGVGCDPD